MCWRQACPGLILIRHRRLARGCEVLQGIAPMVWGLRHVRHCPCAVPLPATGSPSRVLPSMLLRQLEQGPQGDLAVYVKVLPGTLLVMFFILIAPLAPVI